VDVTAEDAKFVRELLHRRAAILLDGEKDYLIEMRLAQLAGVSGALSVGELIEQARRGIADADTKIVEALATHETFFFRDIHPFEVLRREVLPRIIAQRQVSKRLTIWCAACSSGQEPYSVAMLLREHFPELAQWQVRIIATDLSEQILSKARSATFTQMEVNRGLPAAFLTRHFQQDGLHWKLLPSVRDLIEFRKLNLIDPWVLTPQPDLVFMRNVLIYFDLPTKRRILDRVRQQIASDGVLFLGAAETTLNVVEGWDRVAGDKWTYYQAKVQR
jgi:chemotaxis protein methyltransferase CheR